MNPIDALVHLGPDGPGWHGTIDDARRYVEPFTARANENFTVLSGLVPVELRPGFAAVYAFCRWADDLGDETGAGPEARARSLELLSWWRASFDRALATEGDHPVMVALADAAIRYRLTPRHFHDLIDAFEQDQRKMRYRTWDEALGYCVKSANPVGRLVLELGGLPMSDAAVGSDANLAETRRLSDLVCTALQLTNHWQDVRRDLLERDRVYLPADDTGISEDDLRRGIEQPDDCVFRARYIRAVRALVDRTREMYEQAEGLPDRAGPGLGAVVWMFAEGGRRTLERIEASGNTTLWRRPRLGKVAKAGILVRARLRRRTAPTAVRRTSGGTP